MKAKTLTVFDFDDTLVKTTCRIKVITKTGREKWLDPATFNQYNPRKGEQFCFQEFAEVKEPVMLSHMDKFKRDIVTNKKVYILTSRDKRRPIRKFLADIGIDVSKVAVITLGSSNPEDKADWLQHKAQKYNFDSVYFADDSPKNIEAVKNRFEKTSKRVILDLVT